MIAAHLTAYRGLLGLAIQGVIKLRLVLLAGRFCFVERWPVAGEKHTCVYRKLYPH
jgi:hypothetical protein